MAALDLLYALSNAELIALRDKLYLDLFTSGGLMRTGVSSGDVSVTKAFGMQPMDLWAAISFEYRRRGIAVSGITTPRVTRQRMVFDR